MAFRSLRLGALLLSACVTALVSTSAGAGPAEEPAHPASLDEAIIKSAARHGIPESLVRRVVMRESKYNPLARNHRYWGLMQISYPTAKSMGFKGTPQELLNPVVNLRYAVPYLANAFIIAGKRQDAAVRLYAAGYYDTAKRRGLLGMLRTADSKPLSGVPDEPEAIANIAPPAPQPQDTGIFGALFGPGQMTREQQPQVASADPSQPVAVQQPAAAPVPPTRAATAADTKPVDDKASDDVTLVADKHGNLQPPKKWLRDGGTTTIERGEQPVERLASLQGTAEKSGRGRHHKTTLFAAIDAQPASAQAYAGPPDQRMMQADSQAAITQATSAQPVPVAQEQQPAVAPAPAASTTTVADDDSKARSHKRHAHRGHHKDAPEEAVAQAPAAPAPDGQAQPQGAAMAPAPRQDAAATDERPQPQPTQQALDASGYPADAGGRATETAEAASPAKPKRHVARHGHQRKTAVATAQDDTKSPSATTQQ